MPNSFSMEASVSSFDLTHRSRHTPYIYTEAGISGPQRIGKEFTLTNNIPILTYHRVHPDHETTVPNDEGRINLGEFRRQMEYLDAQGYTAVTHHDLAGWLYDGTTLPQRTLLQSTSTTTVSTSSRTPFRFCRNTTFARLSSRSPIWRTGSRCRQWKPIRPWTGSIWNS